MGHRLWPAIQTGHYLGLNLFEAIQTSQHTAPWPFVAQSRAQHRGSAAVLASQPPNFIPSYLLAAPAARYMVLHALSLALLLSQVSCQRELENCNDCSAAGESLEDTSFLQAKAKGGERVQGPHIEGLGPHESGNSNPWAKTAMKKFNHHRHNHQKVVDSSDYRQDAADFYETIKDLSLAERCPMVKIMTLTEVQHEFRKELKKLEKKKEELDEDEYHDRLEDLKGDFPSMLDHGKPVIVEGSVPKQLGWKAADHWGADELANFMGDIPWSRSTFNYPDWIISLNNHTTLKSYIANHESAGNIFLFASENGCNDEDKSLKTIVDSVRSQFAPSPEFGYGPETCEAIIAVDGIGSSHGFHCHDPVWNTQVSGTKHWWLLEPWYGSNMVDEDGLMEWGGAPKLPNANLTDTFEYPNACAFLKEVAPPPGVIKCITKPGEMLLLPEAWMHATCGLTEFTIGAGGWLGGLEPRPAHGK